MGNEKRFVVKGNQLINARYDFTLLEMKVFLMAVSQIDTSDKTFSIYRLYIKDFESSINTKSHDIYHRVREAVEGLMKKIVEIPREEKGKFLLVQLF
jgi:plasmid replication initiation protein